MHIKSVKFENHDILGDLELDFCNADGMPNNTIIIAGGNGIGKSVILNEIQKSSIKSATNIKIETDFVLGKKSDIERAAKSYWKGFGNNFEPIIDKIVNDNYYFKNKIGGNVQNLGSLSGAEFINLFQSYIYPASLHFDSSAVQSVTNRTEDMAPSSTTLGETITKDFNQTLVDIRTADDRESAAFSRNNRAIVPLELIDARSKKFKECFDKFFDGKTLLLNPKINTNIEFEENGKIFPIQQLSTGEKQIVYRAGSMLAYKTALTGSIVLFDEPEISMHPEWQTKIVSFYRELLGEDTQIIIATHSPFIIHGSPFAKKIIIQKDENGKREVMEQPRFYNYNETEAVYGFDLSSLLKEASPVQVLVEGKTDKLILETAWDKLFQEPCPYSFIDMEGASKINSFLNFYRVMSEQKIVGLFDFDSVYGQWNGAFGNFKVSKSAESKKGLLNKHKEFNCWAALLPVPIHRKLFASQELGGNSYLSIEFLFEDALIDQKFLSEKISQTGHTYNVFNDAKNLKVNFAQSVVNFTQADFIHFKPIFELLKGIREGNYD